MIAVKKTYCSDAEIVGDDINFEMVSDIINHLEDTVLGLSVGEEAEKALQCFVLFRQYVENYDNWQETKKQYLIRSLTILEGRSQYISKEDICLKIISIINNINNYEIEYNNKEIEIKEKNKIKLNLNINLFVYVLYSIIFLFISAQYGLFSKPIGYFMENNQLFNNEEDKQTTENIDYNAVKSIEPVNDPIVEIVENPKVEEKAKSDPIDSNKSKIISSYEALSQGDNPSADFALGHLYETDSDLQDLSLAKYWYEKAGRKGNVAAMYNLGLLLLKDNNSSNWEAGVSWLRKAANFGLVSAQFNLGLALSEGIGVKRDIEEAFIWFSLASIDKDKDAIKMRDQLYKQLDSSQKERAQALLSVWHPQLIDEKSNIDIEKLLPSIKP